MKNDTHEWHQRTDCIYGNSLNFTTYNKDLPLDKLSPNPCGMIINSGTESIIDHRRVKYISFAKDLKDFKYAPDEEPRVAYIADTDNHCIRQLSVDQAYVSTIAGICGSPGI